MKKILKKLSLLLLLSVFITSCERDDNSVNTDQGSQIDEHINLTENFGNEVTRNFIGQVVDESKNPISGVEISIGDLTTETDEHGVFILNNAEVYEEFAFIKAKKLGYIDGSRSLVPTENINNVKIMLLEENFISSFNSNEPATVNLPNGNGASVKFDGDFKTANNESYSGQVNVSLVHLNPNDEDMNIQMPGMLYAATQDNEERMLQSYGMLSVELRGENGEELNLANGSQAELNFPLDTNLNSTAPQSIPLWYFSEEKGYWIESGEATLEGNRYVGKVSHFSFWNCDLPFHTVNLCLQVVDQNGNPLSNATLEVSLGSNNYPLPTIYAQTDSNGQVCGKIPSNEMLNINIITGYNCSNAFPISVGPYSTDTTDTVTINVPPTQTQNITGNLVDCSSNLVTNGYVIFDYNGETSIYPTTNGNFDFNILSCPPNNNFDIQGVDQTNIKTSIISNHIFTQPTTNIGTINVCDNALEFITYTIDNQQPITITSNIEVSYSINPNDNNRGWIEIYTQPGNDMYFFMSGVLNNPNQVGTYPYYNPQSTNSLGIEIVETFIPHMDHNIVHNITFNVTQFGTVGSHIDIDFSGTYTDIDGNTHTVNGDIHVLRDQ